MRASQLGTHEALCFYRMIPCPNAPGCDVTIVARQVERHLESECLLRRTISCDNDGCQFKVSINVAVFSRAKDPLAFSEIKFRHSLCLFLAHIVAVVVWEGCDAAKALPGLHHGDRAFRQVNSLFRTHYNFNLPGRGRPIGGIHQEVLPPR